MEHGSDGSHANADEPRRHDADRDGDGHDDGDGQGGHDDEQGIGSFVRAHEHEIIEAWKTSARALPAAQRLSEEQLTDHIPQIVQSIAVIGSALAMGRDERGFHTKPAQHGQRRLEEGFDLWQVVDEFSMLRQCMLRLWDRDSANRLRSDAPLILNRAIDRVISVSIDQYTTAHNRSLHALDRISQVALESRSLDELSNGLLRALVETLPTIDIVMLFLRESDHLKLRATRGVELDRACAIPIGEAFVGHEVGQEATQRRPQEIGSAVSAALLRHPALRDTRVLALHGVPLIDAGEIIGVVQVGSLAAHSLPEQDKALLGKMIQRASSALSQHLMRETAEARSEQLHRLEDLISVHSDFFYLFDRERRLLYTSPSLLRVWGIELDEAVGKTFAELGYPPHLADLHARKLDQALAGSTVHGDSSFTDPSGRTRLYEYTFVPMPNERGQVTAVAGIAHDVTERVLLEQARRFLGEASEIFASSLDHRKTLQQVAELAATRLADICIIDLAGAGDQLERVAVASPFSDTRATLSELARRFPTGPRDELGVREVIRSGEPQLIVDFNNEMLQKLAHDPEHLRLMRELSVTSAISVPMVAHGRVLGAVTLMCTQPGRRLQHHDLEAARELGRRAALAVDNARLYGEAQDATRSREEMLAVVSHDLRNPLSAIRMSAVLLLGRLSEDAPARKAIETIQRATSRMEHLIGDLLDLANLQVGHLSVQLEVQQADALLHEAAEQHLPLAQERGLQLRVDARAPGARVCCDRERIAQVLGNLLGNAIKFSRPDDTITLSTSVHEPEVVFAVADTGPGIAPQDLVHVFESYWTRDTSSRTGTGLGLSIAKGIVETHHGRIWAQSALGTGSTFFFSLPLSQEQA